MKDSTQNIELVERYFDNEMTEDEKTKFQESLKTDLELRHLFDRERLLINTVRYGAAKTNLDFLKDFDKSLPEVTLDDNTRSISSRWTYYAAVAAGVALVVVAGVFTFMPDNSSEELYAEYFQPYPNVFEPTVRGNASATKRAQAFQKYEEGEYQQAASLFSELISENPEPGIILLLGNSNLMLGKTQEAIQNFDDVAGKPGKIAPAAKWYLALAYIRNNDVGNATILLTELSETDNPYASQARGLLDQLDY